MMPYILFWMGRFYAWNDLGFFDGHHVFVHFEDFNLRLISSGIPNSKIALLKNTDWPTIKNKCPGSNHSNPHSIWQEFTYRSNCVPNHLVQITFSSTKVYIFVHDQLLFFQKRINVNTSMWKMCVVNFKVLWPIDVIV